VSRRLYQVKYEPLALAALEEAAIYIKEHDSSGAASSWLRAMLASAQKLKMLPKAFPIWTEREGRPIFAKLVNPYRVFYFVEDETATVHVIDVVHTARETRLAQYRAEP
jgi:plasmid stabilization system protein ParE